VYVTVRLLVTRAVFVVTAVVVAAVTIVVAEVETEVMVLRFELPRRYPTPAPITIATTSRDAITPFLMPEVVPSGRIYAYS